MELNPLEGLKVLRKKFKAYTVKNPDQKFFYGRYRFSSYL